MKFLPIIYKRAFCTTRLSYEIPDEYHNSFYLANATLLQVVNYFIHSSYKIVFPELVDKVKSRLNCSTEEASSTVRSCIKRLDRCEAVFDLHVPLKRFHGGYDIVKSNRVYHGLSFYNQSLGGLRFDPDLLRQSSQGFAAQATYRNALFGINMGGASGGIRISPYILDASEVQDILFNYISRIPKYENFIDMIEPDFGTTAAEMDILHINQSKTSHILALGKSEERGGHPEHLKASARCVVQCLKHFLDNKHIQKKLELPNAELEEKTYILQGLGKVGKEIAMLMAKTGAKCVGVREHDCTIYEPAGIHIKALFKHLTKYGTIRGFSQKCHEHELDAIFLQPCDIIILAALERCISCNIADKVQAKVLVEVANLPITPTAYKILVGKSKLIIPSILAGSGSTLLSYYEYKMGVEENKLDPRNVTSLFNASMQTVIDDVLDIENQMNLKFNYLNATYIRAIRNVFKHIIEKHLVAEKTQQKLISMQ